jgi:hypothetical protein
MTEVGEGGKRESGIDRGYVESRGGREGREGVRG